MARRPKPHPDPHAQLRFFQRNQVPSPYGENATFRAFTVGTSTPSVTSPTLAMVALGAMLAAARPVGAWMVLDYHGSEACVDAVCARMRQGLGAQAPIAAVGGARTPVALWIFADLSCVLTERSPDGLRIYPGVLYLRSRDAHWTPKFLLGRGKKRVPQLRIERGEPPTGWKKDDDRHAALFGERDLLHVPARWPQPAMTHRDAGFWGALLREDADLFHEAFGQMRGHALWPEATSFEAPTTRLTRAPWEHPEATASAWPAFLPHRGPNPALIAEATATFQAVAGWIAALRHTFGLPATTILARAARGEHKGGLEVLMLLRGQAPRRGGQGPQHRAHTCIFHPNNGAFATMFPHAINERVRAALVPEPGSRCRIDEDGIWEDAWAPAVGIAEGNVSAHTALASLGVWGMPNPQERDLWIQAFAGK